MGKKKKTRSSKTKEINTEKPPRGDETPEEVKPNPLIINIVHGIFFMLLGFFAWSGYMAYFRGNFSQLLMLGFALGGFLVAVLSRQLSASGYFTYYRVLAIIFFALISVMFYFIESLDGFLTALLCVAGFSIMIASLLPVIREGLPPAKMAIIGLSVLIAGLIFMMVLGTSTETRRRATVSFEGNLNYFGTVFQPDEDRMFLLGDNWLFLEDEKMSQREITFRAIHQVHPDKFLVDQARQQMKELENISRAPKKKTQDEDPADPEEVSSTQENKATEKEENGNQIYTTRGNYFSWSTQRQGNFAAVAAVSEKGDKNSLFLLDLENRRRIDVDTSGDKEYIFGWKSRTYPGYTTWNPDDTRFFALVRRQDKTRLLVGDLETGNRIELPRDDVIGAFWRDPDTLMLVCGQSTPMENDTPGFARFSRQVAFETFDFIPGEASLYRWDAHSGEMEAVAQLPEGTLLSSIHPLSGNLFCFDGSRVHTFDGDSGFNASSFPHVPDPLQSGISPDGTMIFLAHGGEVLLGDLTSGSIKPVDSEADLAYHITFSRDGKQVLYTSCTPPSALMFACRFKVYNIEKSKMVSFVPNFITATLRASTSFPYAYPSDGQLGQIYFDHKHFIKQFFKEPIRKTTLWVIFPRTIELELETGNEKESDPSGADPNEKDEDSATPKEEHPEPSPDPEDSPGTPLPFTGIVSPTASDIPGEEPLPESPESPESMEAPMEKTTEKP